MAEAKILNLASFEDVETLKQTTKSQGEKISQVKQDLSSNSSYLLQSIKQQNRAILDIEFEPGSIDASNGIIGEAEKSIRTKNFIDLSFYDEFIFNNLRQYAYNGNIVYYNDDKTYNSYTQIDKYTRDSIVDKTTRYIKIVISEVYADNYPISDWNKYFYFEGVVNKQNEEKTNYFIDDVYSSLAINNNIALSNKIDKIFNIGTASFIDDATKKAIFLMLNLMKDIVLH